MQAVLYTFSLSGKKNVPAGPLNLKTTGLFSSGLRPAFCHHPTAFSNVGPCIYC